MRVVWINDMDYHFIGNVCATFKVKNVYKSLGNDRIQKEKDRRMDLVRGYSKRILPGQNICHLIMYTIAYFVFGDYFFVLHVK